LRLQPLALCGIDGVLELGDQFFIQRRRSAGLKARRFLLAPLGGVSRNGLCRHEGTGIR
jgi:hypothetical protein